MRDILRVLTTQLADQIRLLRPDRRRAERLRRLGSIAEIRQAADRALPKAIFDFVDGGSCDEVTVRRNASSFDALAIAPRYLVDVSSVDISTAVLGQRVAAPVLGAPTGLCGLVHKDGEMALARALQDAGSIYTLAAMSSFTIEEVRAAAPTGRLWFQTYLWRDHTVVDSLVQRAEEAGYEALVVTVDVPRSSDRRRDRANRLTVPPRITARAVVDGVRRPRWTRDFLLHPRVTAANVANLGDDAVSVASYVDRQFDPSATWGDLAALRRRWDGHLIVKGLMRPDDAVRAADAGADAVIVSNHGGRQLDQAPATLDVLPSIVDAVGSRVEVYVDGGVRRGSDVLKAKALGARACLVGRPIVFGLGAAGRDGAAAAVRLLADELAATMMLAGVQSFDAVDHDVLVRQPDHHRPPHDQLAMS